MVISCHQYTKVGDLQAMTAMTLLDDSRNWGHFWKIKKYSWNISVSNLCMYMYPTYASICSEPVLSPKSDMADLHTMADVSLSTSVLQPGRNWLIVLLLGAGHKE
jgi:hypothetical protein